MYLSNADSDRMCSPSRLIGRSKCAKRPFEDYDADYYDTESYWDSEEYYDTADYYDAAVYRMDKIRQSPVFLHSSAIKD